MVKNLPANVEDSRCKFDPCALEIPWRRKWQTSPVFLPRKPHEQRSLACYHPRGCRESDMTEQLSTHNSTLQSVLHITILDLITVGRD